MSFPDSSEKERLFSAGIVSFREYRGEKRFLLLRHANGRHWSFPKGILEEGEAPNEAAVRELAEETGLKVLKFVPDFRRTVSYSFTRDEKVFKKTVIYFLGLVSRGPVELSSEHLDHKWLPRGQARPTLTFDNDKQLLDSAMASLRNSFDRS